jgi:hypothetical protein
VMYLNPGSAGARLFRLPITIARLDLRSHPWSVDFVDLSDAKLQETPVPGLACATILPELTCGKMWKLKTPGWAVKGTFNAL